MTTNFHIVELSPDQIAMLGACVALAYYDYDTDRLKTDKPAELIDAAIILEETCLMLPDWLSQLKLYYTRIATMMRQFAAEVRKFDQGN